MYARHYPEFKYSLKIEIARLSTPAITQTSIIIKYSLNSLYGVNASSVTKKMLRRQSLSNKFIACFRFLKH